MYYSNGSPPLSLGPPLSQEESKKSFHCATAVRDRKPLVHFFLQASLLHPPSGRAMCPAPWNNDPLPAHLLLSKLEPETQENHDTAESSDVSVPTREHPLSHPTVDAPICVECQALELTFFDPGCQGCRRELQAKPSSQNGIAHVFAVLRQWVPQVHEYSVVHNRIYALLFAQFSYNILSIGSAKCRFFGWRSPSSWGSSR